MIQQLQDKQSSKMSLVCFMKVDILDIIIIILFWDSSL